MVIYSHAMSSDFCYTDIVEKYPFLNQAVGNVLHYLRTEAGMSKRKLSEIAMIERAYITGLENAKWNVTLNGLFFLCDALGIDPADFLQLVKKEMSRLSTQ